MLTFLMVMADCILQGFRVDTPAGREPRPNDGKWQVNCCDALTGQTVSAVWTQDQLAAVLYLAQEGSDGQSPIASILYPIAEDAIKGWPKECRPIP